MDKYKLWINGFCTTTTGSLIGMLVTVELMQPHLMIRRIDLWGLILANILILLWEQVAYYKAGHSKIEFWVRLLVHYIGTMIILYGIAIHLHWLGLERGENILLYGSVITMIYGVVSAMIIRGSYQTSKAINEALSKYQKRKE